MLRDLRIAAGLSQDALAAAAGISAAAIGSYERGVRYAPHRDSVTPLADALGLSAEQRRAFEEAARTKPRTRRVFNLDAKAPAPRALPAEITTFVGRESEVAELKHVLDRERVVTITGPGGVGKTRVALRVASGLHRPDGIWFVDLAAVREPARVLAKIFSVVPFPTRDEETPEALAASLGNRHAVLVFDNCEHVLDAVGAVITALVRIAPNVAVLATSRFRLNVSSEFVFRLAPLAFPEGSPLSAREARRYPAVDLFVLRANVADQRFIFSDEHVEAVVDICRRLEGMPLAVELAAARLPMFGIATLRRKLGDRLDLLKTSIRDVPERQQTFRATIDWSYDLLDEAERLLLKRLAVFSGGCTLESAEDVCADDVMPRDWIVDGLAALVDRSLVAADISQNPPRYTLFESMRQYALEKLSADERRDLTRRHASWCASFADEVRFASLKLTHDEWRELVLPEFDNIYQAIDWTEANDALLFARIVGSLYFMWWRIGRPEEGRRFAGLALSQLDEERYPAVAAPLHLARTIILKLTERLTVTERAVALLERLGEPPGMIEAYIHLGGVYLLTRDAARLGPLVERIAALVQRKDERALAPLVSWLRGGWYTLDGRYADAREVLVAALYEPKVADQEAGYVIGQQLANVEYFLGNVQRAAALCDELAAASRRRRLVNYEMYALIKSAGFHILLGDLDRAKRSAHDALVASSQRNVIVFNAALQHLATIAALDRDVVRAARLHGYTEARLSGESEFDVDLPFSSRDLLKATLAERLPAAERESTMAAGAFLSESAATAEALQERAAS